MLKKTMVTVNLKVLTLLIFFYLHQSACILVGGILINNNNTDIKKENPANCSITKASFNIEISVDGFSRKLHIPLKDVNGTSCDNINTLEVKWKGIRKHLEKKVHDVHEEINRLRTTDIYLEFLPKAENSNLIHYNTSDINSIRYWENSLTHFLRKYIDVLKDDLDTLERCSPGNGPSANKVCMVDILSFNRFSPCSIEHSYGFQNYKSGPCIFLQMNKVLDWIPQYYNSSNLPEGQEIPDYLKQTIRESEYVNKNNEKVWVTCEGKSPADKENIGPIRYMPHMGFSSEYFPFKNQKRYMSPLVIAYFEQPKRGVIINVVCRILAKNIINDEQSGKGIANFNLLID